MRPVRVYTTKEAIAEITTIVNAHENAAHGKAVQAARRQWRQFRLGLPGYIRTAVMGDAIFVFLPGVVVAYDYIEFLEFTHLRRDGE